MKHSTITHTLAASSLLLASGLLQAAVVVDCTLPEDSAEGMVPICGGIDTASGALAGLTPAGDSPFSGDFETSDDNVTAGKVLLKGFCFNSIAAGAPPSGINPAPGADTGPDAAEGTPYCPNTKTAVPIFATGDTTYEGGPGGRNEFPPVAGTTFLQAGSDFNAATGGLMKLMAYSPSFNVNIAIDIEFEPDGTGKLSADAGILGTASGPVKWEPVIVPVPAAAWLFGSAVIGLFGIKRRARRQV